MDGGAAPRRRRELEFRLFIIESHASALQTLAAHTSSCDGGAAANRARGFSEIDKVTYTPLRRQPRRRVRQKRHDPQIEGAVAARPSPPIFHCSKNGRAHGDLGPFEHRGLFRADVPSFCH